MRILDNSNDINEISVKIKFFSEKIILKIKKTNEILNISDFCVSGYLLKNLFDKKNSTITPHDKDIIVKLILVDISKLKLLYKSYIDDGGLELIAFLYRLFNIKNIDKAILIAAI